MQNVSTFHLDAERHTYERAKQTILDIYGDDIDEQTLLDTLEGETNIHEFIGKLAQMALMDEAYANAVQERINDLGVRKARFTDRATATRESILRVMESIDLKKITQPEVTVSVSKVGPKVILTDETILPEEFLKPQPPKPDKTAIKEALKEGREVSGAQLSNGGSSLIIRSK